MGFYVPTIRCQFVWFGSHNRGSHQGRKGALWLPSPRLVAFPKRTNTVFAILTYCRVLFKGHFLAQRKSRHCIEQIVNQPQNKKAHEQKSYSDVAALRFDHPLQWKLVRPGNFLEFSINYVTMQAFADVMVTCEDATCLTVLQPLPSPLSNHWLNKRNDGRKPGSQNTQHLLPSGCDHDTRLSAMQPWSRTRQKHESLSWPPASNAFLAKISQPSGPSIWAKLNHSLLCFLAVFTWSSAYYFLPRHPPNSR